MARYRRRGQAGIEQRTVDPGKDLFAYLFILIMVFSFMLLMTTEERHSRRHDQKAPQSLKAARSQVSEVSPAGIGRLEKGDQGIVLVFEGQRYQPWQDIDRLTADGRITISQRADGGSDRTLYLAVDNAQEFSLAEYLAAFSFLGEQGINVAFAEKVR